MSLVRQTGSCVYVLYIEAHDVFKIGYTRRLSTRLRDWKRTIPFEEMRLIVLHYLKNASQLEAALHQRFDQNRIKNSEWFRLNEEQLDCLTQNTRDLCEELMVDYEIEHARTEPTPIPDANEDANQNGKEKHATALLFLDNSWAVIEELKSAYQEMGSWNAVADHYDVSRAVVYRVANSYYQPRDAETRIKLGLPILTRRIRFELLEYALALERVET